MLTPKKIAIPAAVGFVISFVISLFFAHSLFLLTFCSARFWNSRQMWKFLPQKSLLLWETR